MTPPWLSRLEVHPVGDGSFQLHTGGFIVAEGMPRMVAEALAGLAAENERQGRTIDSLIKAMLAADQELLLVQALLEVDGKSIRFEKPKERR